MTDQDSHVAEVALDPCAAPHALETRGLAPLHTLRALVAERAIEDGRTESPHAGLRYYRFMQPVAFRKTQVLMPGLVAVLQGRKVASFGDRQLAYDSLNYLVLASEAVCDSTVVAASPQRPYLALSLDLPPDVLAKTLIALADAEGSSASVAVQAFTSPLDDATVDALARLLRAVDERTERRLIAPLIVEEIALRLLRSPAAAQLRRAIGGTRDAQQIQAAMRFMRERLSGPLSVEQVARHVAMSPSHFAHRFRAIARVSPMRYLRELRLHEARALLLGGGLRPSQAALRVGYDSASHFTRDFKGSFGLAPTEYVRRLRDV